MNFTVAKFNDALVLALLHLDTPMYRGPVVYPVPMMEEKETAELRERVMLNHPFVESGIQRIRPGYHVMLNLTSSMALVPFLLVAAYAMQMTTRGETYVAEAASGRSRDIFIAAVATVYTGYLVYAGGLKFLVLSAILYAPGSLLYVWARREQGKKVFERTSDMLILAAASIAAVVGVYWIATGYIVL